MNQRPGRKIWSVIVLRSLFMLSVLRRVPLHDIHVRALSTMPSSFSATTGHPQTNRDKPRLIFHWFRNDLRLHDNPALTYSVQNSEVCIPVFVFDERVYGNGDDKAIAARLPLTHSLKWGSKRAQFLIESVHVLRSSLQKQSSQSKSAPSLSSKQEVESGDTNKRETTDTVAAIASSTATTNVFGGGLVVLYGDLETVFDQLIQAVQDSYQYSIVCQEEPLQEELDAVKRVQSCLKKAKAHQQRIHTVWGSTMYELSELPFDQSLEDMPDVYTPFRTRVEKMCMIPKPLPPPRRMLATTWDQHPSLLDNSFLQSALTFLPTLETLGYTREQIEYANQVDPRGVLEFRGGETCALQRLQTYIWDQDLLQHYFDLRNGMLGADYSSKLSPWLALGCLSPRKVALECHKYEQQRVQNKSTYWLVFELLWRDYCKFFCVKHGNAVFYPSGTKNTRVSNRPSKKWSTYEKNFQAWKDGLTGYPLVDANMRELLASGWMSNRGRQNVCSFLAINMNHDWRFGAEWFESQLLDYDVYSNWFNWCSGAGMTGGRLNRFNIVKQSKDYDQKGDYVRHWIPELKDVPTEYVHEPWKMNLFQQQQFNVRLGVDYPNPVIPFSDPKPYEKGGSGGNGSRGKSSSHDHEKKGKQRKPNKGSNPHQKYEMKGLITGRFELK